MNTNEIFFGAQQKITLFSAKNYRVESTFEITRKVRVPALVFLEMDAIPNLIPKSILPPSGQNRIQCFNVPCFRKSYRKLLELEEVKFLHVCIVDLEETVWLGFVNGPAVDILVWTCFMIRCVWGIFDSLRKVTVRKSRPVYIIALERKNEKSANSVFASHE